VEIDFKAKKELSHKRP